MNLPDVISATMARYGKKLNGVDIVLWMEDLRGIDERVAAAAFAAHRQDPDRGQFAPTAADIIRRVRGSNEERALMAWSTVRGAVRQHGHYKSVDFGSPLVHGVLAEMGGWSAITDMTTFDVEARKTEFIKRFCTYASRGILPPHCPAKMQGLLEGKPIRVALPFQEQAAVAITATQAAAAIAKKAGELTSR